MDNAPTYVAAHGVVSEPVRDFVGELGHGVRVVLLGRGGPTE